MKCNEIKLCLINYLLEKQEISKDEFKAIELHNKSCSDCFKYAKEIRKIIELIRDYKNLQDLENSNRFYELILLPNVNEKSDEELMKNYQDGDDSNLTVLFNRYKKSAVTFAYNLTSNHCLSEDIGQESFLHLIKSKNTYKYPSKFSTWFFQIINNICKDMYRSRLYKQTQKTISIDSPLSQDEESMKLLRKLEDVSLKHADVKLENENEMELFKRAIRLLPEIYIDVIILHYIQGLKYNEVGEAVGCSENTARARMYIAINCLRKTIFNLY